MNETFEKICKMTQKKLKTYVEKELAKTHEEVYVGDGYVYAQGTFPVLLLAHLDTVHKQTPKVILQDEQNGKLSSPQGIGGDDRCGVFMVLEIVKRFKCSVLFCEDEEIGGVGARKFIKSDVAKGLEFNYAIEFDRKGKNDAVFYDCDNDDFEDFITDDYYKTAYGSFSDISVVAPFLKCAAVNLSCGYYNAHTTAEYVVVTEMLESINAACSILERTTEDKKFEYIEATYSGRYYGGYGYDSYGYGYGGYGYGSYGKCRRYNGYWAKESDNEEEEDKDRYIYYVIEYADVYGCMQWCDTLATSEAEAVGKFLMEYPNLTYGHIIDIMHDANYGQ